MKKISVIRAGVSIDLFEYIEDFYLISEKANPALAELRKGLSTWVSAECYSKMNICFPQRVSLSILFTKSRGWMKRISLI